LNPYEKCRLKRGNEQAPQKSLWHVIDDGGGYKTEGLGRNKNAKRGCSSKAVRPDF